MKKLFAISLAVLMVLAAVGTDNRTGNGGSNDRRAY